MCHRHYLIRGAPASRRASQVSSTAVPKTISLATARRKLLKYAGGDGDMGPNIVVNFSGGQDAGTIERVLDVSIMPSLVSSGKRRQLGLRGPMLNPRAPIFSHDVSMMFRFLRKCRSPSPKNACQALGLALDNWRAIGRSAPRLTLADNPVDDARYTLQAYLLLQAELSGDEAINVLNL